MSPAERRSLREQLVALTEGSDHRLARVAEHLHRACEQIELATREESSDDTAARRGLLRARIDVYSTVRSVLACLQSQARRRDQAPPITVSSTGAVVARVTVRP